MKLQAIVPLIVLILGAAPGQNAYAATSDFVSDYYAVGLSRQAPAFAFFSVDSLGRGEVIGNPATDEAISAVGLQLVNPAKGKYEYRLASSENTNGSWQVLCGAKSIRLCSRYLPSVESPPFILTFNQHSNHATLLGLMSPGERKMPLPCLLHLPDMGTCQITSKQRSQKLDYDARRSVSMPYVKISFPPATREQSYVEYKLDVVSIYPRLPGIESDPLFDGFRRNFLNIFQVNPRLQMLANNSSSDACAFTLYEYSDVARRAPPLAKGLTSLDLVRMTLDRYLAGVKTYGMAGCSAGTDGADNIAWPTPYNSLDSYPSLLIAACNYATGAKDWKWAEHNYEKLVAWAREIIKTDSDGNGLIEYSGSGNFGDRPTVNRRPANWWDTINFGYEDAYSNALAYRACVMFAELSRQLRHKEQAELFAERARRLRDAYVPTFLNPKTGMLAGWRSADGKLHDYGFTFVNGIAVSYGLVDGKDARAIMSNLLQKMERVGYTNFALGLPGNLVPVRKGDYINENRIIESARSIGQPQLDDGSDAFQYYENGGATACFAGFTVQALYQVGRVEAARRIFYPMLESYASGKFQGFGSNGASKDWRDWAGGGHGYEGFLAENYLALLATFDEVKVRR